MEYRTYYLETDKYGRFLGQRSTKRLATEAGNGFRSPESAQQRGNDPLLPATDPVTATDPTLTKGRLRYECGILPLFAPESVH